MNKFTLNFCFHLFLVLQAISVSAEDLREDIDEYIKIEVDYHNEASGLIWAYKCFSCTPKRFLFDGRTVVELENKKFDVSFLKKIDGSAATISWIPNTSQALRIIPMEINLIKD